MSNVPAAKRSAAITYRSASTRAWASIHGCGLYARSAAGTTTRFSPRRSTWMAAAFTTRWAISAALMQRTRFSFQASAVIGASLEENPWNTDETDKTDELG